MDALERALLFDTYGSMLTEKQKEYFDMRYNQDLSLGEIGEILGISRQGVHDNLSRAETLLRNMEEKTGCVRRSLQNRSVLREILQTAQELAAHSDPVVRELSGRIVAAAQGLEE